MLTGQAEFGTVRPGQLADIPAIDGGPLAGLDDSANVSLVIQDGDILIDNLNSCHAGDETQSPGRFAFHGPRGLALLQELRDGMGNGKQLGIASSSLGDRQSGRRSLRPMHRQRDGAAIKKVDR